MIRMSTGIRLGPADPLDLPVLQHAQQPHLRRQRHLADLVEEDRAPVGPLEAAALAGQRAGEGALLVPEQLAVEKRVGDGAAVDRDERPVTARRAEVDGVGDDVLADPGLAGQQHRALGGRDVADLVHHLAQTEVGADDLVAGDAQQLLLQVPVVVGQPVPQAHHLAMDEDVGQGDGERLLEKAEQPRVVGSVAVGALGGQHHGADPSVVGRQPHPQDRPARDAVEAQHLAGHRVLVFGVDHDGLLRVLLLGTPDLLPRVVAERRQQIDCLAGLGGGGGQGPHGSEIRLEDLQEHAVHGNELADVARTGAHRVLDRQIAADSERGAAEELVLVDHRLPRSSVTVFGESIL